ncbi:GTPase Era [Parasaccharibacter sp. TMW2.1882]|uniref:GTPase Era n=1 Tax=Bombella apis TaxID=1785988 RepID=A0ABR9MN25_9PROT|nr:GTPase Era [Bombella apis]MBE1722974.1 GTPase Era [Bombella apis]MBR9730781.1 GTPase Era [Bombella apis]MCL1496496.1 GTPase Era [Parasaccharibacter sp. TMW2.1882]MUG79156.1 GTPase Era [Bombella sp. ESL0380]
MPEDTEKTATGGETRCGFVALVGAPNAGKSTLLNRMAGAKLSIVSPKAQTTRFRTLGIVMRDTAQIVFVDLPGIFKPRRRLDQAMVNAAWSGSQDADLNLLLVDSRIGLTDEIREIIARLKEGKRPVWLVLNKTDLIQRDQLLPLTKAITDLLPVEEVYMVSARSGDGVEGLLDGLARAMPVGPYHYPEDDLTDLPDRLLAAEIVREQVFLQTHEEIPYHATVETESFKTRKDGSIRIDVTIYVSRAGHKAILIGERGQRIREIGMRARKQLEGLLDAPCHLFLNVKERAAWDKETARLRALGLADYG